jgi:hypothetical protein
MNISPLGEKYLQECVNRKVIDIVPDVAAKYKHLFEKKAPQSQLIMQELVTPATINEVVLRSKLSKKQVSSWIYNNVTGPMAKVQKYDDGQYILTDEGSVAYYRNNK